MLLWTKSPHEVECVPVREPRARVATRPPIPREALARKSNPNPSQITGPVVLPLSRNHKRLVGLTRMLLRAGDLFVWLILEVARDLEQGHARLSQALRSAR